MKGQAQKYYPESDASPSGGRGCDHPGCDGRGEFRAPKSRNSLQEYYWFCLEHVREYNRTWDYFAGFKPEEIEAAIRADITWQRPTWPLGHMGGMHYHYSGEAARDPFDLFGAEAWHPAGDRPTRNSAEEAAMKEMDLKDPLTVDRLKRRYKELCKRHHPDANGGDKASEERFKKLGQAYKTLMESLNSSV